MFELKHLKTISVLAQTNSISKAATQLFTSQSALSHQIKELEQRLDEKIFIRGRQPICFTPAGQILLKLAQQLLPEITLAQQQLKALQQPVVQNKISITFACHACFQWLVPVLNQLKVEYPNFDIALNPPVFEATTEQRYIDQEASSSAANIELLFTDQKPTTNRHSQRTCKIGDFELVAVMAPDHELTTKPFLTPQDFNGQTLLAYPIAKAQLDIFNHFLSPANIEPKQLKAIDNSYTILQMVAADMGIACLPNWLVASASMQSLVITKPLGESGLHKHLYLQQASSSNHQLNQVIATITEQAIQAFKQIN